MIFIGLGSNKGNRLYYLTQAIERIQQHNILVVRTSMVYETIPWGVETIQMPYLNMVIELSTDLSPRALLQCLQGVERSLGRKPSGQWQMREIDLDILFYHHHCIWEPDLKIPHPFLQERPFTLIPLAELAPDFIDPITGLTIKQLQNRLPNGGWHDILGYFPLPTHLQPQPIASLKNS